MNTILNLRGGILGDPVQDEIRRAVQDGSMPIADIISDIIKAKQDRDSINYGLFRRSILEPASKFDWNDPRKADGIPILAREKTSQVDVNHRIANDFQQTIIDQKVGYIASDIQITEGNSFSEWWDAIRMKDKLTDCMSMCTNSGTSYLFLYPSKTGAKVRNLDNWEACVIYNQETGEPEYGLRYWEVIDNIKDAQTGAITTKKNYWCEWYDSRNVSYFEGTDGELRSVAFQGASVRPHGFGTTSSPGIPIIELPNNRNRIGNVERVTALIDAYDILMSDLSTEHSQMRLAYLLMSGAMQVDAEFKEKLEKTGIIPVDTDGDARFITKDLNVEAFKELRETIRANIFALSSSYDPGENKGNQTAYEIQQRFFPLETDSQKTVQAWVTGLEYMIERLNVYGGLTGGVRADDVEFNFVRTIPRNRMQDLIDATQAGIQLSNKQKIEYSPLDVDIEENETELSEERSILIDNMTVTDGEPEQ